MAGANAVPPPPLPCWAWKSS